MFVEVLFLIEEIDNLVVDIIGSLIFKGNI